MVDKNKFFEVILREYTNQRTRKILKTQPELAVTHFKEHNGTSLLHLAASRGNCELARLLQNAAKGLGRIIINIRDNDDNAPMHWAAMCGHLDMVKYLHSEGALLSPKNIVNTTPLSDAAGAGRTEVVKYILKKDGIRGLFEKNAYNLDAYARTVYSLQPETLEVIVGLAVQDVHARKQLGEMVGEGFNVLDIAESFALQVKSGQPETQTRIRKIISILQKAGLTPSAHWQRLSRKERSNVLTIDHAGKWKQFQKKREKLSDME